MATTEERLAALEKQMAAWMAQQPTTYYTHQYSGEEIDNAVSRALPNGAIDQAAGTFVRPNLLDNWYFGRPVNQRGKSEYTGSGYMVDRWTAKEGVVSLSSGGLTLQNRTWLDQMIENLIENRIYTISLLTTNGVLLAGTGLLNKDSFISVRIDGGGYIDISYHADVSRYYMELARADAAQPLSILAAKLELGSTQTLAHREGDKWVLNEIPDYGEQLRRCLRYCRVDDFTDSYTVAAFGVAVSDTYWRGLLPSYSDMRTKPTIAIIGDNPSVQLIGNGQSINIAGLGPTVISSKTTGTAIGFNGVSGLVANQTYALQLYRCKIIRSADL